MNLAIKIAAIALLLGGLPYAITAAVGASDTGIPPLLLDIVVDDPVFPKQDDTDAIVKARDIIARASLIFHKDIGRQLEIGAIRRQNYTNTSSPVIDKEKIYAGLLSLPDRKGKFAIMITFRIIVDLGTRSTRDGTSRWDLGIAGLTFDKNQQTSAEWLLHEVGHLCRKDSEHSADPASLMHSESTGATTYGIESARIIRTNCGTK